MGRCSSATSDFLFWCAAALALGTLPIGATFGLRDAATPGVASALAASSRKAVSCSVLAPTPNERTTKGSRRCESFFHLVL